MVASVGLCGAQEPKEGKQAPVPGSPSLGCKALSWGWHCACFALPAPSFFTALMGVIVIQGPFLCLSTVRPLGMNAVSPDGSNTCSNLGFMLGMPWERVHQPFRQASPGYRP